ncbi:zinc-binding dehydrogenase [Paenibacillus humicola]|uniref:zinc-binding dehydrogenase n=1 Tax=Paenibacillus humicola TaxID=3110540 RepID=UPI00237A5B53|nr:alcohol dehydrogenase catalytic domain-containing protein [Paenibacillus humicola]
MLRETARAAVWTGTGQMEVRQLPIPEAGEGALLLRVDAASVCGTDGHLFPQNPPYSAILGHEVTGTIVQMGKNANRTQHIFGGPVQVGDRVVLYPWITCGKCEGCLTYGSGTCTVCDNAFVYGIPYEKLGLEGVAGISSDVELFPHFKGGFAEYLYVFPGTYMWKLPDDMPSEVAVLLDPLAVAVRAIELAVMSPGVVEESFTTSSSVVVMGAGPVGALTALVARTMGVERVIIVGGRKERLSITRELSDADAVIDIRETTPEERIKQVKDMTGGKGADVVIQCANVPGAFVEGLDMIRRMGTLIEVGNMVNTGSTVAIDPARQICGKHARIIGMSANSAKAFDKAFHLLKRHAKISYDKLYTHVTSLDELERTLHRMSDGNYMKGLLTFGQ